MDDSLDKVISEDEFRSLLEKEGADFFRAQPLFVGRESGAIFKRAYAALLDAAHQLESFLDDFGARNNRTFAYFTELVGVTRVFAGIGYILKHTLIRYPSYNLGDDREQANFFHTAAEKMLDFCNSVLQGLLEEAGKFARGHLRLGLPSGELEVVSTSEKMSKWHLPHNVDDKEVTTQEQFVAELATRFVRFAERFQDLARDWTSGAIGFEEFLEHGCSEERVRGFESAARAMQLKYDMLIKGTNAEQRGRSLKTLRGHISMALHHLEIAGRTLRYLERVSTGIKDPDIARRLNALIDRKRLTDYLGRYLFVLIQRTMERGRTLAETLIRTFTRSVEYRFTIPEKIALHARPASLIVRIVNHYGTPVTLAIGNDSCDASSIMRVMMTVGSNSGARHITFHGDERPLNDIKLLFENNLGERGLDQLPKELEYLKRV